MVVTYASSQSSMRFFQEALFFLRCLFTLSSHCSRVYPHSQIIHSLPSLLHVHPSVALVLFLLCCWCRLFWVIGWPHSLHPNPLYFLFVSLLVSCPPASRPHCCSPMPARFFHRCLSPLLYSPFTLRRASHSKPLNIYYSPSPSLFHCKIYTPSIVRTTLMLPSP